jgi:hypothetical protein
MPGLLRRGNSHKAGDDLSQLDGDLVSRDVGAHMLTMTANAKKSGRASSDCAKERPVVYRGIRIDPIPGKRSAVAQTLRDALRTKAEQPRGEPARA